MKVLHINTLSTGGAANAAIRLHHGLINLNIDSTFLTKSNVLNNIKNQLIFPNDPNYGYSISKRILGKVGVKPLASSIRAKDFIKLDSEIECFSSPNTDYKLAAYINNELDADVINLHWVANFLDYQEFFSQIKKPVVWTLHDQNPYSSYWHYSSDNIQNRHALKIHSAYISKKLDAIKSCAVPIQIVSPSQWLQNESKRSTVFNHLSHCHIPYSLNTNTFTVLAEKPETYLDFKRNSSETIGLFICQSIQNKRKGMNALIEAMHKISKEKNIRFIAIGEIDEKSRNDMPKNIHFTGTIKDETTLALLYNMVDFTIIPSLQDNLPNTMLESLCCGTPVLGTPAGGIPEVVSKNNYGIVAKDFSAKALLEIIYLFQKNQSHFEKKTIAQSAQKEFGIHVQAEKYVELYQSILS